MSKGLFPSVDNFIKKQQGITDVLGRKIANPVYPWSDAGGLTPGDDVFFPTQYIETEKWDQVFPYRLVVIDANKPGNPIVNGLKGTSTSPVKTSSFKSGTDYIISISPQDRQWVFELPITPQQIQIVDQYAINTTATARGILEEHNGVTYKMISISATTGIFPTRSTTAGGISSPSNFGSVFGGTLEAAQNLNRSLKGLFTGEGSSSSQPAGRVSPTETGYYKAMFLSNFLERYAQEKKKPENKGWRLVLDIPKMSTSYVVTPVTFALQKSVQSPNEFTFSLQLKAWKRVKINQSESPQKEAAKLKPNDFQNILRKIRSARSVLGNTINLLKAVRSDFRTPFEALRQSALAVKDLAGVVYTAADLPGNIVNDIKSSISDSLKIVSTAFIRGAGRPAVPVVIPKPKLGSTPQIKMDFIASSIRSENINNEGLSLAQVNAGDLGSDARNAAILNGSNELFQNPEEFFDLLDSINIDSLTLSPEQRVRIENELKKTSLITVEDLKNYKNNLLETALLISNNYGAGDELYSQIYGLPKPKKRVLPLTIEETEVISAIFEAIEALDLLTSTQFVDNVKIQNPLEFVGGLANEAEIDFADADGKIIQPVPFGLTIEQIAARYLGDANRWLEIVTLNKLRFPYIDEEGFTYPLLSNGNGRQINVNDQAKNIYIGQTLYLSSNVVTLFKRKVINVERISDTNYLVTLDGDANLDNLTTLQKAKVKGYKAGTVNSQNQIFIPATGAVIEDDLVTIPKKFRQDNLAKISKVDWLLDENGDLAINEAGDIQLAAGLTNLIQALKIKIKTRKGSILQHPEFGLGIQHGISLADVESGEILQSFTKLIQDDPRYSGINRLNIRLTGSNTLFIDLAVNLPNGAGILPITFEV
jgi:hypothetical protein